MYTDINKPLFRSVSYERYSKVYGANLELLKNYGVYYWQRFSNTSKEQACIGEDGPRVNFEIYMSETQVSDDGIPTSIDITKDPV